MSHNLIKKEHPYKHWQYINCETGDRLRIVPERGGLITEWRCNNHEILYFDLDRFKTKGKSVRGGIPILFPICGDLTGDLLQLPQGKFQMNQHGFARDMPWKINALSLESGFSLELTDTEKSRASFPFLFLIKIQVKLNNNTLVMKTLVYNRGREKMPFSFGLHPYFQVNNLENVVIKGLPETCTNHEDMSVTSTNSQLSRLSDGVDFLTYSNGSVSLIDEDNGASIEMQNQYPMDLSVFWTDPPRKMVCMEPWTGPRGALLNGNRMLVLEPGKSQELICRFVSN